MKRRTFIKELIGQGCYLKRHGGRHDLYINPANGKVSPVPRHPEIKDLTCRLIRQQLGLGSY
jgi:predicted RNA binding protein YcfA (HicA-like mRNA interferase family)